MHKQVTRKYKEISEDYSKYISVINSTFSPIYTNNLPKNCSRVLDVGCGSGDMLKEIHRKVPKVELYGVDPTPEFVKKATAAVPDSTVTLGRVEKLPFDDNFIDCVISHIVFQHVNRDTALTEIVRVLNSHGRVIITEILSSRLNLGYKHIVLSKLSQIRRDLAVALLLGPKEYFSCKNYAKSDDWRELTNIHRDRRLSYIELTSFYSNHLPGCRFKILNNNLVTVIWDKN